MKKKLYLSILASALTIGLLGACGTDNNNGDNGDMNRNDSLNNDQGIVDDADREGDLNDNLDDDDGDGNGDLDGNMNDSKNNDRNN